MPARLSAKVTYSNGFAAQGVSVSVFDEDSVEKLDDDLTTLPGVSDRSGFFSVQYDPSKYKDGSQVEVMAPRNPPFDWTLEAHTRIVLDPTDTYQPYLRFKYSLNGQDKIFKANLKTSQQVYTLPDQLNQPFLPSQHGWKFVNAFSGFFLPFALPVIPGLTNPSSVYGLCGGMSAGALDMFLNNRPIPAATAVPENGSPIQRYLYKRQLDSLGTLGEVIFRFADWMGLPDDTNHGTQKLTLDEFEKKIRPSLNHFLPVPIGLLYVKWNDTREVWQNHQVLAIRYENAGGKLRIFICDPNYPSRDDIYIEAEKVDLGGVSGLRCVQHIGSDTTKKLYAFFAMPYQSVTPPEDI